MTKIHFGPYSKTVFNENRGVGNKRHKLEINTQSYSLPEKNQDLQTIQTARLVYNCGFLVDTACYESLLPKTHDWHSMNLEVFDTFFPILNQHFHQFSFGKSMQRWRDEIPGFGPCLAFNCQYQSNTELQLAIQDSLLGYRMSLDDQSYRLIDRGMGFYLGPKGEAKKEQRNSIESFPPSDPLSPENRCTYKNEINLDLRFALGKEHTADSVMMDERYFYHGKHPLISCSLNIHLAPSDDHSSRLMHWNDIHASITQHVDPFRRFVTRSLSSNHLTTPDQFTNNGYWSKADKIMQRRYQPTDQDFIEQTIIESDPTQARISVTQVYPITGVFSCSDTHNKRASMPAEKKPPVGILPSKNIFSALSTDSSDESETEADQDKASNLTL